MFKHSALLLTEHNFTARLEGEQMVPCTDSCHNAEAFDNTPPAPSQNKHRATFSLSHKNIKGITNFNSTTQQAVQSFKH